MGQFDAPPSKRTKRFLSRAEVAQHLGLSSVKSLSRLSLPEPDVLVGYHKGWLPATIDKWNEARPGPGWHGRRDKVGT